MSVSWGEILEKGFAGIFSRLLNSSAKRGAIDEKNTDFPGPGPDPIHDECRARIGLYDNDCRKECFR
jgi:hypothetical protein